ncbi:hypothetical protein BC937DRAFT_89591 [Endogone sp. FLAS-F59071]|nr:hypothetical protein BC937DRAFT_89591 [Endogone sp. FLAS-F59071]|eukprot:RUS17712.1 hypothetical protein BC937DRAFT_89591 [Endogone sp. FLAS-F59071]
MNAEGTDVGAGFAANPEDGQVAVIIKLEEFTLMNGTDAELAFNGGDERRTLEESAGQRLKGLCIPDIASSRFQWNRADEVHTRTPYQHFAAI